MSVTATTGSLTCSRVCTGESALSREEALKTMMGETRRDTSQLADDMTDRQLLDGKVVQQDGHK